MKLTAGMVTEKNGSIGLALIKVMPLLNVVTTNEPKGKLLLEVLLRDDLSFYQ